MPKMNEQADVIMGAGGVPGSFNGTSYPFPTYGRGAFINPNKLIVAQSPTAALGFWDRGTPICKTIQPLVYANAVAGGGDQWIAMGEVPDGSRDSYLFGTIPNLRYAGFGDVAFDGTIAFKSVYQSNNGITIIPPGAFRPPSLNWPYEIPPDWINLPDAFVPYDLQALPGGKALWRYGAYGIPMIKPYFDAMGTKLITTSDGTVWICYWSNGRPGLILQPDGADEGFVLEERGVAFNHDAVAIGNEIYVASSWTQGEGPNDIVLLKASRRGGVTYLRDVDPNRVVPRWTRFSQPKPPDPEPPPIVEQPVLTIASYEVTGPLQCYALAELIKGDFRTLTWWYRPLGATDWIFAVTNPAYDLDHTYHFDKAGDYEIKLSGKDTQGNNAETGRQRVVTVTEPIVPPEPVPIPPTTPGKIPPIGDDEIIELAEIYDSQPVNQPKKDSDYFRDNEYYGLGYARNRTYLDHPTARDQYEYAASRDAYYDQLPPGMFTNDEVIDVSQRFCDRYKEIGHYQQQSRFENGRDQTYYAIDYARQREAGKDHERAMQQMERDMCAEAGLPDPYPPPPGPPIEGRIRVVSRRFQHEAGWFPWRGISDLSAISYVKRGVPTQLAERLDNYRSSFRTVVRCCGMLSWSGNDFSPRESGYWQWLEDTYSLITARSMYMELCMFADAQIIVPDPNERKAWLDQFANFIKSHEGVIPQIANEPFKNGWSGALDPALLDLAERLASALGHRDFSIGDPQDGDNPDASAETTAACIELSKRSNIVPMHPDRSQHGDQSRWRRWIDHLEGFTDVLSQLSGQATIVLDEPMGAGPEYIDGRRDNDPDAFVAAQTVGLCTTMGYTYHWIVEEGLNSGSLPGVKPDFLPHIPVSSDWSYRNDSWAGSPTNGITWTGKTGKMRSLVRGNQAWTVAYGEGDWNSVKWRDGYHPTVVYVTPRCCVWSVNQ
jgi:hypothetical protein